MRPPVRVTRLRFWLFPLLVAFLVLGHACDLPAYAGLMAHHDVEGSTESPEHDHADEHALVCDGALVAAGSASLSVQSSPALVAGSLPTVIAAFRVAPLKPVALSNASAGPPLFLLFSSLLI